MTKQQLALRSMALASERGIDPRNSVIGQGRIFNSLKWMLDTVEWDQSEKEWARMQGEGKELQS